MKFQLYTTGLYSSYCYNESFNVLFDAGEGVATTLRNRVYGVNHIFISHDHWDHIGGLIGLLTIRNAARGDREKEITVYYSKKLTRMQEVIDLAKKRGAKNVKFVKIDAGFRLELKNNIFVEAFDVKHSKGSLGYKIVEKRSRLSENFRTKSREAIVAAKQNGVAVTEDYEHPLFVYTLDAYRFDINHITNADWWIADATFLKEEDRDGNTHASLPEVVSQAHYANVKNTVLGHISPRYNEKESFGALKLTKCSVHHKIYIPKQGKFYHR